MTVDGASPREVAVLRRDAKPLLTGVGPDLRVRALLEAQLDHVHRARKEIGESLDQAAREVLVEEELHFADSSVSLRSRSAA